MFHRPTTMANLQKIEEVAVEKAERYGAPVLAEISKFCTSRGCKSDVMPEEHTEQQKAQVSRH